MARKRKVTTVVFRLGSISVRKRKNAQNTFRLYLDIRGAKRQYDFQSLTGLELTGIAEEDAPTIELVRSIVLERNRELVANRNGVDYYSPKRLDADFIAYYAQLSEKKNRKAWTNTLVHLKRFCGGENATLSFRFVTVKWLESFKEYLLANVSDITAHVYFVTIKTALIAAKKDDIIINNPGDKVDNIKYRDRIKVFLTLEELRLLYVTDCSSEIVKRSFIFACFTGLRFCDVKALKGKDIRSDNWVDIIQKKTGSQVSIPLHPVAKEMLGELENPEALIFPLLSTTNTLEVLRAWVKAAGITKHIVFHTARHTFAVLSQEANNDIYATSGLLGHSSVRTTQIYAQLVDSTKKETVNKIPNLSPSNH